MILEIFLGSAVLSFPKEYIPEVLNAASGLDIRMRVEVGEDDNARLHILMPDIKKLKKALPPKIWGLIQIETRGLPTLFLRYRRRWGIAVGALIFAVLVPLSSSVIWTVDVSGNKNISDKYIKEMLKEEGFGVGSFIKNVDLDSVHNRFLIDSEGIGWISVNINGTHANVEVRETRPGTKKADNGACYNLIAAEDGQIERVAAIEGKPQIKIFDTVQKGELLVSGVISREEGGIRLESAEGSVFAKVNRSFEVKVPLESEKKVYTGNKKVKKTLKFFNFDINLFRNSGIPYDFYDTIISERQIYLFNTVALPLWVISSSDEEYEKRLCTLSEAEARDEAMLLYRERLKEQLKGCELLTKETEIISDENEVIIKCELYCIADIAVSSELIIEKTEETDG